MKYFKLLPSARETANVKKYSSCPGKLPTPISLRHYCGAPLEKYKQLQR
jgi:hypothetical protein